MTDATAEGFFGNFKREKKSAEVEGVGTIYFYEPPSVAERDAFYRHVMHMDEGRVFSLEAIVDGIIARVKDGNSRPLFKHIHRARMLAEMSEEQLLAIWRAVGGDKLQSADEVLEGAEKK